MTEQLAHRAFRETLEQPERKASKALRVTRATLATRVRPGLTQRLPDPQAQQATRGRLVQLVTTGLQVQPDLQAQQVQLDRQAPLATQAQRAAQAQRAQVFPLVALRVRSLPRLTRPILIRNGLRPLAAALLLNYTQKTQAALLHLVLRVQMQWLLAMVLFLPVLRLSLLGGLTPPAQTPSQQLLPTIH